MDFPPRSKIQALRNHNISFIRLNVSNDTTCNNTNTNPIETKRFSDSIDIQKARNSSKSVPDSKEYTIQENTFLITLKILLADPRELGDRERKRKRKRDRPILLLFAKCPRTRGKTRQGCSLSRHFLDIPAYICLGGGSITRRGPFEFPKGNSKLLNGYGELFKADARDSAWMGYRVR